MYLVVFHVMGDGYVARAYYYDREEVSAGTLEMLEATILPRFYKEYPNAQPRSVWVQLYAVFTL